MKPKQAFSFQDESLTRYFEEISQTALLSFDEELDLSRRVETGDVKAQETLVRANLRLVVKIAKAYLKFGVALLDLIQEGNLGLMTAAAKYDYRKNVRFSTYASWWIKQSIVRAIANKGRFIRLPHRKEEMLRRIMGYLGEVGLRGGHPSSDQIALELKLDRNEVLGLLEMSGPMASLDKEINEESSTILDVLEDLNYQPDRILLDECVKEDTRKLLAKLLDKERTILLHRFAFEGDKRATLKTIGQKMGLSAETVRQIELRALQKLRSQSEIVKDYLYS